MLSNSCLGVLRFRRMTVFLSCLALALLPCLSGPPVALSADGTRGGRISQDGLVGAYYFPQGEVSGLAEFQGRLYVGTGAGESGPCGIWSLEGDSWRIETPPGFREGPPDEWDNAVPCMSVFKGRLYAGTSNLAGCEIWRTDGSSWERVVGPGASVSRGFGNSKNTTASSMAVWKDPATSTDYLYVGTSNQDGLQVWRTSDGIAWQRVDGGAFGSGNREASCMTVFRFGTADVILVGTYNSSGGEVWGSANGTSWVMGIVPGFGNPQNVRIASMASWTDPTTSTEYLFAGTENQATGLEIYSTSNGIFWGRNDGGAFGSQNLAATSMAVFGSQLYVGTRGTQALQVWRYDGSGWTQVNTGPLHPDKYHSNTIARAMLVRGGKLLVGAGWLGELWEYDGSGWERLYFTFFSPNTNSTVSGMAVYDGLLYAGTAGERGCEVYSFDGSAWRACARSSVFGDLNKRVESMAVFKGRLYVGTWNRLGGCEVWAYGGSDWTCLVGPGGLIGGGFRNLIATDINTAATSMAVYIGPDAKERLYVGTYNSQGCEVWSYDGASWTCEVGASGPMPQGFGVASNRGAESMAVYGGKLFVGTQRAGGGQVWAYDGSGWSKVGADGFGYSDNYSVSCMECFGSLLAAGTWNSASGCEVWVYDGTAWARMASEGFTSPAHVEAESMTVFGGRLYVGTRNDTSGGAVFSTDGTGKPFTWERETAEGFGNAYNRAVESLEVYFSSVIAGVHNAYDGGSAWALGNTWYLAEGCTDAGFETYVLVQNPSIYPRHVSFTLNTGGGEVKPPELQNVEIGPGSRRTFLLNAYVTTTNTGGGEVKPPELQNVEIGPGSRRTFLLNAYVTTTDVSTRVECSDGLVICERAEYWRPGVASPWAVGHDCCGLNTPHTTWYLAEGATDLGFETFVLVQNPGGAAAHVDFTLNTGGGEVKPPELQNVEIGPGSRRTFLLNAYVTTTDVSTLVQSRDRPVICERAVYWRPAAGSPWAVGHDSAGLNAPGRTWYLAEGATDLGFETYVLVQNPGPSAVHVDFTLNTGGGEVRPTALQNVEIPKGSRRTFLLNAYVTTTDVSTKVSCRDGMV
uniref:DUF5719 family protein n=1 Tax=Candidatus Solincola tengchongensis TaxID=2900693 RepID=UPI00257AC641